MVDYDLNVNKLQSLNLISFSQILNLVGSGAVSDLLIHCDWST